MLNIWKLVWKKQLDFYGVDNSHICFVLMHLVSKMQKNTSPPTADEDDEDDTGQPKLCLTENHHKE